MHSLAEPHALLAARASYFVGGPEGSRPAKHSSTKLSGNREVLVVGGLGFFVEDPLSTPNSNIVGFCFLETKSIIKSI